MIRFARSRMMCGCAASPNVNEMVAAVVTTA